MVLLWNLNEIEYINAIAHFLANDEPQLSEDDWWYSKVEETHPVGF